ncbi:2,3-diaminopropionate biosynthesis protein SbnA [Streptomyces sp. VRA16 Mangrove soil]|uniref:2,3-diaminopropionate biosynthesis protein SbnA n=1 Tax=Streptomyces sp. VRA16 Mangrove soil TaxID=2817434 RepID=UPI001A9E53D0|nr:2,3-diaminopropionate biosynthesis protein SbnA [Streptomyces sp. VRA16 Mangrove soil]MBO1334078.1 2,3-diaminopropionate biosynthesis protein SbnA [Streptomyces sp. VRA16 Mangrove soil]
MKEKAAGGILGTVGGTPLVELSKLAPDFPGRVFAKIEGFNPGGSIKDRTAVSMVLDAIKSGEIDPVRSVVVESSSGNLAVGIAQLCRYHGIRFICVVDAKTSRQNLAILRAYGAEIEEVTEPDPVSGEYLERRLRRVRHLVATLPHAFWPNQYANPQNPAAHERTMREIADALDGKVDYLFCATSTTGTLQGCAQYAREHSLGTTMVAVDAVGSVLFDDRGEKVTRLIPGHGASVRPALFDPTAADRVVHVTDLETVVGCRRLVGREAVLAGGSSGAVVAAFQQISGSIPAGSHCVLLFPDRGDRYLDTIYDDRWVSERFGEISQLWKTGS